VVIDESEYSDEQPVYSVGQKQAVWPEMFDVDVEDSKPVNDDNDV
jgi:hypothetical protein